MDTNNSYKFSLLSFLSLHAPDVLELVRTRTQEHNESPIIPETDCNKFQCELPVIPETDCNKFQCELPAIPETVCNTIQCETLGTPETVCNKIQCESPVIPETVCNKIQRESPAIPETVCNTIQCELPAIPETDCNKFQCELPAIPETVCNKIQCELPVIPETDCNKFQCELPAIPETVCNEIVSSIVNSCLDNNFSTISTEPTCATSASAETRAVTPPETEEQFFRRFRGRSFKMSKSVMMENMPTKNLCVCDNDSFNDTAKYPNSVRFLLNGRGTIVDIKMDTDDAIVP